MTDKVIKIKTRYGTFYEVEIPLDQNVEKLREGCALNKMREMAYLTLKKEGVGCATEYNSYLTFYGYRGTSRPTRCRAAYFKYEYKN